MINSKRKTSLTFEKIGGGGTSQWPASMVTVVQWAHSLQGRGPGHSGATHALWVQGLTFQAPTLRLVSGGVRVPPLHTHTHTLLAPRRGTAADKRLLPPVSPAFQHLPQRRSKYFLLSVNFLFAFGLDSNPPRFQDAYHLSFPGEESFLSCSQNSQTSFVLLHLGLPSAFPC